MANPPDYVRKKYGPLQEKTLRNALAHRIHREFPRIGGPRIRELCADMILEVIAAHVRAQSTVSHGQTLWMAVSIDNPPQRHQRIRDTDLVPVVLELSTAEDVQRRLDRVSASERLLHKALRLCRQAHAQGGLLSNCDLAELLSTGDGRIAEVLAAYERQTQQIVPRRATLHDVGTGLTHKAIICWKRYAEGKEAHQIARETRHSGSEGHTAIGVTLEGLLDPPVDKTPLEDLRQELAAKDVELPGQGRRKGQGKGFGRHDMVTLAH